MLVLRIFTCLLPYLLGIIMNRFLLIHPAISLAFLITWIILSFLLHSCYKKRTIILSLHGTGILLLILQLLSIMDGIPFFRGILGIYYLPAMQITMLPLSRIFYLIFGQVTMNQGYCASLLAMIGASYLGCFLRSKYKKPKQ